MKEGIIQDEKIVSKKRKIGSDALGIIYFGLIVSILIQQIMFDAPFSEHTAEFILIVVAMYVVAGIVGNYFFSNGFDRQKNVAMNSFVCGLIITAVTTTLHVMNLGLEKMGGANDIAITALITFSSGTLASFIGFEFLYLNNKKRQKNK